MRGQALTRLSAVDAQSVDSNSGDRDLDATSLFRAHSTFVCSFIERLGIRAPTSHDLVQDVFLIVHRKGGYRAGAAKPRTWLAGIALGVVRNHRRRMQTRTRGAVLLHPDAQERHTGPDSLCERADARRALSRVKRALDALDEDQRVVFMLYELEGQSTSAIAAGLGIATGTVYSRLHTARKAFRKAYDAQDHAHLTTLILRSEAS